MPSSPPEIPGSKPLSGEIVVFSGKLGSLGRREARDLVTTLGGETADEVTARTTILVVAADGPHPPAPAGDAPAPSARQRRAEDLIAHGARLRLLTEDDFCGLVGRPSPSELKRQYHASSDLRHRYPAIREDHLRYLTKYGIIQPVLRTPSDTYYPFAALAALKQTHDGLQQGLSFRSIVRALTAAQAGQLTFDFRLDAEPARIVTLTRPAKAATTAPLRLGGRSGASSTAEDFFREASALDDGNEETHEEAAAAYRKALEADPDLVPALINLANLHYTRDEVEEAHALYERAIRLEPDFFEAHFNLANIYHDLGEYHDAQACYREALRLNPQYAEGHFYLAVTLEKMGLSQEARPHWRAYQNLAPLGEWVELAREFSE